MRRNAWLGIEVRHFAALEAIATQRSFRGAANRLGYVQSAISRQIAFLEQTTGMRLIERSQGPRPVHLTKAGEVMLQHAHDILASIEAARYDMDRFVSGTPDEVQLGVFAGVPARIFARALTTFAGRRPEVRVSTIEAATDVPFFKLLQEGSIDLAFLCLPGEEGPFETCELLQVPWVLVVPAGTELAAQSRPPTAADLAQLPLIGAKTARLSSSIETRLRSDAGTPRIVFRSDVAETAHALAAAGVGAAILPRLAIEPRDPRTEHIELGDLIPPLSVGLAWHRHRRLSGAVAEFRDVLLQVCRARHDTAHDEERRRFARRAEADPAAGRTTIEVFDPP